MDEPESRVWRVSGTVQGVGFRWFVSRNARALQVDGWVRNLSSGEVLIHARGATRQLQELRSIVETGPPGSRVERVDEVEDPGAAPPVSPFSIIR